MALGDSYPVELLDDQGNRVATEVAAVQFTNGADQPSRSGCGSQPFVPVTLTIPVAVNGGGDFTGVAYTDDDNGIAFFGTNGDSGPISVQGITDGADPPTLTDGQVVFLSGDLTIWAIAAGVLASTEFFGGSHQVGDVAFSAKVDISHGLAIGTDNSGFVTHSDPQVILAGQDGSTSLPNAIVGDIALASTGLWVCVDATPDAQVWTIRSQAAFVDPATATAEDIATALIAANLMAAS